MNQQSLIVVTGATGNIGSKIASDLLALGQRVRVVGRDGARLNSLASKGAEVFVGSLEDKATAVEAFQGATAVFAMLPPNYTAEDQRGSQDVVGEALAHAIKVNRIPHVVNLSSMGAHIGEGVGPISGLAAQEKRLNEISGTNVIHLRPGFFFENLLAQLPLIESQNIAGSAFEGRLKTPMIATQDIAAVAVDYLLHLDFQGKEVRELFGQRDLSMDEAIAILGKAIGKHDLKYITFPYQAAKKGLVDAGFSASAASLMVEMAKATNDGILQGTEARSPRNTTLTSLESFVRNLNVNLAA